MMSLLLDMVGEHVVTLVISGLLILLLKRFFQTRRSPPGPWSLPWIGHLFLLNKGDIKQVFRQLRAEYGDLVSLSLGSQSILLVSGQDMLQEVFVKHGKYFDKRPRVFTTLKIGQGKAVVNASGPAWKEHRSFLVKNMKEMGISKSTFESNVIDELQPFLHLLESTLGRDVDPSHSLQTATCNIICSISFGKRFDYEDRDFKDILEIVDSNMKLVGATSIVNYFPCLEYLPGDAFRCKECLNNVDKIQKIFKTWIERHRALLDPENPRDLIDSYLLEMQEKCRNSIDTTMNEEQLLKLIGDLFVGGTETTATTLRWALVFLVHHPEVQQEVYSEILSTLKGRSQLSIEDQHQMPFTSAVILESQRLGDIAPFSLPHSNSEPVAVGGYVIPAGSLVIPNVNSVHMDPSLWEDPCKFRPRRFLNEEGKVVKSSALMPFFIGPRMCPGRNLAKLELFHFITSIVQHFHVVPSASEGLPSMEGHLGVTFTPSAHRLRFVPRGVEEAGNS